MQDYPPTIITTSESLVTPAAASALCTLSLKLSMNNFS